MNMRRSNNSHNQEFLSTKQLFLALCMILTLFGFYSFAPIVNLIAAEGSSAISIVIRALASGGVLLSLFLLRRSMDARLTLYVAPLFIFLTLYCFRLYDNIFLQNIEVYVDPLLAFSFLIGGGLLPALFAARIGYGGEISDRNIGMVMILFNIIFIIGLLLNSESFVESESSRASLDRINPIAIAATSLQFVIFHIFFFGKSKFHKLCTIILVPILITIAILANSRGPIVSFFAVFAFYTLTASAQYRRNALMLIFFTIMSLILVHILYDFNIIELVFGRFFDTSTNAIGSNQTRLSSLLAAMDDFAKNPFFGKYIFDSFSLFYPHNIIAEAAISLGIIGLGLLFYFVGQAIYSCLMIFKNPNSSRFSIAMACYFIFTLVGSMFSGAIWSSSLVWITGAYVTGYALYFKNKSPKHKRKKHRSSIPRQNLSPV